MADYRAQAQTLDAVVEYHQMSFNLIGRGEASRVQTGVVSANFFDTLGVTPLMGRTFVARDDTKDAPPVLVLSYDYWKNALGGDPHVIGRTFEMNDKVHTVVGVLPPVPQYPQENDVYMPVAACPFRSAPSMAEDRTMRMVSAIGRMRPGVSLERASGDLDVIAKRMAATYPDAYKGAAAAGFTTRALSIKDELTRRARPTLLVLLVTTLFVLLLVAANVANLTLARMIGRERELSLRDGARRGARAHRAAAADRERAARARRRRARPALRLRGARHARRVHGEVHGARRRDRHRSRGARLRARRVAADGPGLRHRAGVLPARAARRRAQGRTARRRRSPPAARGTCSSARRSPSRSSCSSARD